MWPPDWQFSGFIAGPDNHAVRSANFSHQPPGPSALWPASKTHGFSACDAGEPSGAPRAGANSGPLRVLHTLGLASLPSLILQLPSGRFLSHWRAQPAAPDRQAPGRAVLSGQPLLGLLSILGVALLPGAHAARQPRRALKDAPFPAGAAVTSCPRLSFHPVHVLAGPTPAPSPETQEERTPAFPSCLLPHTLPGSAAPPPAPALPATTRSPVPTRMRKGPPRSLPHPPPGSVRLAPRQPDSQTSAEP